jgi:RNA polymerase sigma factor (sigma-70 family)
MLILKSEQDKSDAFSLSMMLKTYEQQSPEKLASLVSEIQQGSEIATEELCHLLTRGIRSLLRRRVGDQDFADAVQEVLLDVLKAIKAGHLRQAEAVLAFARSVALRKSAAFIAAAVADRSHRVEVTDYTTMSVRVDDQPENKYFEDERRQLATRALMRLKPREREILERFYVAEESEPYICNQMGLTATQFRLLKNRAKVKFGNVGRAIQGAPAADHTSRHSRLSSWRACA